MRLPVELEDVESALRIGMDGRLATRVRVWWKKIQISRRPINFSSPQLQQKRALQNKSVAVPGNAETIEETRYLAHIGQDL
jgi:hypothetical protein